MKRRPSEVVVLAVSLALALVLAACNSGSPVLRYMVISPATSTISVSTTQQYTATGYYSNGAIMSGISVTWASTNPAVATIDPVAGLATAVAAGTTTINAYASGVTATSATLSVNALTNLTISPTNQTINATQTEQFSATGTFKNPDGTTSTTDVSSQVTWSSSNTNVFTISSSGLASPVGPNGSSVISAALDGLTASTNLTIGPPVPVSLSIAMTPTSIAVGNSTVLTATENWSDGTTGHIPTAAVTWSSGTTGQANVVAIGADTASVAGFAAGTPAITASEALSTPITGMVNVTVVAGTAHYAYVSNSGTNGSNPYSIGQYMVTATATPYVAPQSTPTVPTPGLSPQQTVLDPNGQYLYMVATSNNVVATLFTVNSSTGALTQSSGTPTQVSAAPDTTQSIIDPYGRFLYVSEFTNNLVYAFQINPSTGALTAVMGSPFSTNVSGPVSLIADHSGQYLYVVNAGGGSSGGGSISGYTIDQTQTATGGALTPFTTNPTIDTGASPNFSAIDPTGTYIYVPDFKANTVTTYSIGTGGALTNSNTTTAVSGATALWNVAVDPSGKYLYVLDQGSPTASPATNGAVYQFNLTSGIPGTAPVGSAVSTGLSPNGIVVDPTTSLVAVENEGDQANPSTISLFTIGSTGALTAQTPVATGVAPFFVIFYDAP
jgi:6-phosphogluconolactonase (cycloisomerase 2 family)